MPRIRNEPYGVLIESAEALRVHWTADRVASLNDVAPLLGEETRRENQIWLPSAAGRASARQGPGAWRSVSLSTATKPNPPDGHAGLIAAGREILNSPNWRMDAALKLGSEGPFRQVSPHFLLVWTRPKPGFGTKRATCKVGLEVPGKVCDFLGLARPQSDSNIISNVRRRILACFLTHSGIRLRSDFS